MRIFPENRLKKLICGHPGECFTRHPVSGNKSIIFLALFKGYLITSC